MKRKALVVDDDAITKDFFKKYSPPSTLVSKKNMVTVSG